MCPAVRIASTAACLSSCMSAKVDETKTWSFFFCAILSLSSIHFSQNSSVRCEGLQTALNMLQTGQAEGIVVVKLDRLSRNVSDLGLLIQNYFNTYALMSVSEQVDTRSASGRLVLNVLTSVAQWELEAIGERTSQALQYKKTQGERVGTIAMGKSLSTDGKSLVENTKERQAIMLAKQYRESGLSLRKVATKLAEQSYFNRLGSRYNARSIAIMVGEA